MKVGDLVCDPHLMRSKYAFCTDRTSGLIIGNDGDNHHAPPSYCSCYKDKFLVWWINANIVYEQCECELSVISIQGDKK